MTPRRSLIRPELEGLAVDINFVRPHPGNPNNGDTDEIVKSLRRHGQFRPIVVHRQTGEILAGNHTYAAMCQLGAKQIAVTYVDADDREDATRILLADNRLRDLARYDVGLLDELLSGLPDMDGTGWTQEAFDRLAQRTVDDPEGIGAPEADLESKGLGTPVVHYDVIFDTEAQQATWFAWLRRLKAQYPDLETVGERLVRFIGEWSDEQ